MNFDEAITLLNEKLCCDYNISGCSSCDISSCEEKDLCNQIAEWLEELKSYKEIGTIEEYKNNVLDIIRAYNKAIDDYNKEIKEYLRKFTVHYVSDNDFDYIAEQLKVGKKNE